MPKSRLRWLNVLALARSAAPVLARSLSNTRSQAIPCAQMDACVERQLERLRLPGAALAVIERDKIVHLRAFGQARPNGEAPTPQTPFFIGSLTKSFTALAVMQLVEAGKVELDAPAQRYLPWFRLADPVVSAQITVRHLLNQTSGLPQTAGMIPLADFDARPDAVERQARKLASLTLTRPVGAAWEYSNLNYNLLGLIVEAASGESYEAYIRGHIFTPLDMRHSHTCKAEAQRDGLAVGHRLWFGSPVPAPDLPVPIGSLPSGQLMASAEDMAHYLIAQLNGGRYHDAQALSAEGVAQMQQPAVAAASMGVDAGAYGMGWFVQPTARGPRIWHNGQTPDFFAYAALLPEQQRGMVLLVNANHMLVNFALLGVGEDIATLLAGAQPSPFAYGAIPWALRGFLLIPVIQAIDVLVTGRDLTKWRLEPGCRPAGAQLWLRHIGLPALLNLAPAAAALALLKTDLRRMILLFMPDLSRLALTCGGFALAWMVARAGLILNGSRISR